MVIRSSDETPPRPDAAGNVVCDDSSIGVGVDNVIDLTSERARRRLASIKSGARLQRMLKEAREHPLGLYRLCFTDDNGDPVILKWFHQEWADMLLHNTHVMIEAPRGSTKTTFIVCCILWFLGHNPELRIKLICGNDANAAKRLSEVRSHINQDPLYKLAFPEVEEDTDNTNNQLILNLRRKRHTKDSTIEAKGVMSDGTGDRADLIILDDVCTRKNSVDEPSTRPKVLGKLRSDWLNTLNPRTGRVWSIFTPWHVEDANAILKKETKGRWAYKRYAHGKAGDPYHSIFPELFTSKWLKSKRLEIGALEYAQAYLCKAISGDVQIVRAPWLRIYNKLDVNRELLRRATAILSVDPTGGKKARKGSDVDYYGFAMFIIDTLLNGNPYRPQCPNRIYLVDAYQVRLSTAHAAQHIIELYSKWQPDQVVIEAQGAQSIHEWVYERDSSIPIAPMPATLSKKARLESITPWLQDYRERVLFHPRTTQLDPQPFNIIVGGKDPTQAEARRTLRTQLLDFPTTHDDVMDAVVQGLRFIRQYVLPFDNTEADEDPHAHDVDVDIKMIAI
jgi:hypothetical protein